MLQRSFDERASGARLDTWKTIALYLGRSSRTVQRWHTAYGLPVHHVSGESGSVYAYPGELDSWLRSRREPGAEGQSFSLDFYRTGPNDIREPSLHPQQVSELIPIHPQTITQSDQLVTLARQMWPTLSHRNLGGIIRCYREAIALNPNNAEAFAGLSVGLIAQVMLGAISPSFGYASARYALDSAVRIGSELPLTKCARAWLDMCNSRHWDRARFIFDEILKNAPSCALFENGRGLGYVAEGRLKDASELFLECAFRNPLRSDSLALHCWSEYLSGAFDYALYRIDEIRVTDEPDPILVAVEALAAIQLEDRDAGLHRVESLAGKYPNHHVVQGALGYACAVSGRPQRTRELLHSMTNQATHRMNHEPYGMALILIGLDQRTDAINALARSYSDGSLWSIGFRSDPVLKALRTDAEFLVFMSKTSYPIPEPPVTPRI